MLLHFDRLYLWLLTVKYWDVRIYILPSLTACVEAGSRIQISRATYVRKGTVKSLAKCEPEEHIMTWWSPSQKYMRTLTFRKKRTCVLQLRHSKPTWNSFSGKGASIDDGPFHHNWALLNNSYRSFSPFDAARALKCKCQTVNRRQVKVLDGSRCSFGDLYPTNYSVHVFVSSLFKLRQLSNESVGEDISNMILWSRNLLVKSPTFCQWIAANWTNQQSILATAVKRKHDEGKV
jgi:hypothetical protein